MPLLFLSLSLCNALFESSRYIVDTTSRLVLQDSLRDPDFPTVSIIYSSQGERIAQISPILLESANKLSNYVKFVAFDCKDDRDACPEESLEQLPLVSLYVPEGVDETKVSENHYEGVITVKDFGKWVTDRLGFLGQTLEDANLDSFLAEKRSKIIFFTSKNTVPLVAKGLSYEFRGRASLGVAFSNAQNVIEKYEVKNFPAVIAIADGQVTKYKGRQELEEMKRFISKFALEEKTGKSEKNEEEENAQAQKQPQVAIQPNKYTFEIAAVMSKEYKKQITEATGVVVVHFYKERKHDDWERISQRYNGIVKIATFQCKTTTEHEFCMDLGIKRLPTIRLYPTNKTRKPLDLTTQQLREKEFEELLSTELVYHIQKIQENGLSTLMNSALTEQRMILLYIGEGPSPIEFIGLASNSLLKDFTKFVHIDVSKDKAPSLFALHQYPNILAAFQINKADEMASMDYKDNLNDYSALFHFAESVSMSSFLHRQPTIPAEDIDDIEQVQDQSEFAAKCLRKPGLCVVGLLDPSSADHQKNIDLLRYLKTVMNLRKQIISHFWIDAACHPEVVDVLGGNNEGIPGLAVIGGNGGRYRIMEDSFEQGKVFGFVEDVIRGKKELSEGKLVRIEGKGCGNDGDGKKGKKKKTMKVHVSDDDL
jgi:thioredoxin-like negative regulator of GroEL